MGNESRFHQGRESPSRISRKVRLMSPAPNGIIATQYVEEVSRRAIQLVETAFKNALACLKFRVTLW
jgi:hypothetical protein